MSPLTIAWSMAAAVCAMMGLTHLLLSVKERRRPVYFLSATMAFSAAAQAMLELSLLRAGSIVEFQSLLRWGNLSVYLLLTSMVWFVYMHFGTARRGLAIAITVLWTLCIIVNFLYPGSLVYLEVAELRTGVAFWGETFTLGSGPTNPWKYLADLTSVLILAYVIDASVRTWRLGNRERAAVVGGSIVLFLVCAGVHTPMVDAGIAASPYMVSFAFLAIVVSMTYELVGTALLASRYSAQAQAKETRWRTLLENVQLLVVGIDPEGRTQYINPYGQKLLGIHDCDIIGEAWIDRMVPRHERAAQWRLLRDRLLRGDCPSHQNRVVSSTGEKLSVKWSNVVLRDAEGVVTQALSIGENVTPQIHAEHEVRRQRDALAHMARVSLMGELAASLAHELNQPLTGMLSNAQAAQRFMAAHPPDLDELRDIMRDLVRDNNRASAVIQRLRALAMKKRRDFTLADICSVVRRVVQLVQDDSIIRHIHVEMDLERQRSPVLGDEVQLQQVILNLLLNAFDAVASLPANEGRVCVGVSGNGDSWEVHLSDNGPGLSHEVLGEIFEPFFSTKRTGMGMGLPICRTIAEDHGGRLWAENNSDRGAMFRFSLPAAQANLTAYVVE